MTFLHPHTLAAALQLAREHAAHPQSLFALQNLNDSRAFASVARAWARAGPKSLKRVRVVVIWQPGKRRAFVVMDLRDAFWLRAGL